MKHLQKITLSNIRRFGELVEIDLAKGATIILAPNGTGKTAIFEAVELALTGNVNRLISTDSLIRDLQQQGSVRLDFGGGKYCETLLSKGAPSLLRGDHQELFADSEPQDRPFLLQLTHFLSQKGNNWFVTRHDKEAGKQLEHLSIGREATEVNEIIPAAKRAATSELQNAQREFDEVNKTWQDWLQLVNKRTYTGLDLSTSLISREELLLLMNGITLHLVGFPTQSSSLLIDLKMLNREISTAGFRYQETLKTRLAELSSLRPLIPELAAALEELQSTSARLRSENERLGNANARIGQLEGTLLSESNKLIVQQKLAQSRRDAKARLEQLQLLEGQLNALNIRVKTADDEISLTTVSLTEATTSLNEAEATERILQTIQKAEENLQKDIDRANLLQLRLEQLQALYRNKEVTGNFIAQQNAAVETAAKRQADAVTSERAALEIMGQSRNTLDILSSANDQLKTAIGTILSLYPKDQGDCPVCGEGYKPDELQQRMQETANKVNPGLAALAEQVEINQSFYNEKVTIKRQTERTLEAENSKLNQLQKDLLQIEKDIASLYEENFGANRSAEEVMGYIDRLQNAIRQARVQITAQKNSIANSQPQQTVAALTDLKMQLENRLDQLLTEKHNLKILLENSLLTRQNLEARLVDTDQIPVINAQLNEIQVLIESIQTHINGLKAEITENVSIVRSARDNAFTEELVVSDLSGRITEFRTRWSNAKLSGDLSDEILNQQIAGEEKKLKVIEADMVAIDQINRELTKWQTVEDELKIEEQIANIIGDRTETDYGQELKQKVDYKSQRLEWIRLNLEILEEFARSLSKELEVVYERIKSVNPLWQKLLKRIIIEPRFSSAELDSFGYYKKSRASVNVKLHDMDVLVSQVASEAQITDLQLTFLLAMAQKYSWTSWKTLLLDDPTQHHDLVHASAVFDLLRDYIADHGFQVLMATHDPVQAKFFMRKLENDGIPVNLVMLNSTEEGVTARSV